MPTSAKHYPYGQAVQSSENQTIGLPYKFFEWADDQEQDEMLDAARDGRLDEFIEQRYGDPPHLFNHVAAPKPNEVDLASFAGRSGSIDFHGLSIRVRVLEARRRFGHIDFLLTPEAGEGERWMEHHRVSLDS